MLPQIPPEILGQRNPEESAAALLKKQGLKKEVYEGQDPQASRLAAIQRRLQRFGGPQQP